MREGLRVEGGDERVVGGQGGGDEEVVQAEAGGRGGGLGHGGERGEGGGRGGERVGERVGEPELLHQRDGEHVVVRRQVVHVGGDPGDGELRETEQPGARLRAASAKEGGWV